MKSNHNHSKLTLTVENVKWLQANNFIHASSNKEVMISYKLIAYYITLVKLTTT